MFTCACFTVTLRSSPLHWVSGVRSNEGEPVCGAAEGNPRVSGGDLVALRPCCRLYVHNSPVGAKWSTFGLTHTVKVLV